MTTINRITRADIAQFRNINWDENSFDEYQEIATKSAIYPGQGTPLGLEYVALKLNGEAGEVAEHVGKAFRDDGIMSVEFDRKDDDGYHYGRIVAGPLTNSRKDALIKEAGDVLWYLSALANELGMTLSEIALANLEKLCDRGEREALRGSGDNR